MVQGVNIQMKISLPPSLFPFLPAQMEFVVKAYPREVIDTVESEWRQIINKSN